MLFPLSSSHWIESCFCLLRLNRHLLLDNISLKNYAVPVQALLCTTFVSSPILCHKYPRLSAREGNRVFLAASKRADRCWINSTVLVMRPDSTEVGPRVWTLGPSLSMRKGDVGVGGKDGGPANQEMQEYGGSSGRGGTVLEVTPGACSVRWDQGASSTVLCSEAAAVQLYNLWVPLLAAAAEPCVRTSLIQSHPNSHLN